MNQEEMTSMWVSYWQNLPESDKQGYQGSCQCVFCQQIREDFYRLISPKGTAA